MGFPFVKIGYDQEGFRKYISTLHWDRWQPKLIVWHNTAAPSLKQWIKSADDDRRAGKIPGITRIQNLERFFRDNQVWNGGPHLFIANDFIWIMNPLTERGTHSPSFNSTAIGIEMIGDFASEDDETGPGLEVKNNTIFATALLCTELGLDPRSAIKLHKEDPRTTHDCPGKNIAQDKHEMIEAVEDLMPGGEHDPEQVAAVIAGKQPVSNFRNPIPVTVTVEGLNFRRGPGVDTKSTGTLPKGTKLTVINEATNGPSRWLQVRTPAGYVGWVSGRYVE